MSVLRWSLLPFCILASSCVGTPLIIVPTGLTNAVVGTAYSQLLVADSSGSLQWSAAGSTLPPGLTLDPSTGELAGTPTAAGTYDFVVTALDPGLPQRTGQGQYSLTVIPRLTLDATLDRARVGIAYEDTPVIAGGVAPYSVTVDLLPGGLDYDRSTGRVFGTPLNEYTSLSLYVTVSDSGAPQQTISRRRTTLTVRPEGVFITTSTLDPATVDQPYTMLVEATGGLQPYTWSVTAGVLPGETSDPKHLVLSQSSGIISGTPRATATTATFTITVTDSDSPASTDSRELKLVIPVVILTATLPDATVGQAYQQALTAGAGLGTYSWSVVTGSLPAGLQLAASTGVISGTVGATAESQTFTVRVTDSDTPATSADAELTIDVGS